jgi:hypothetical protein
MYALLSRKEAQATGEKFFFTGKACKWGHVERRYTASKCCVECVRIDGIKRREENPEYFKEWRQANLEKDKASKKAWQEANKERSRTASKAWAKENTEKVKASKKSWSDKNPDYQQTYFKNNRERLNKANKEWYRNNTKRHKEATAAWRKANKEATLAIGRRNCARRRGRVADQLDRLSPLEKLELAIIYEEAALLGSGWHVDHIIPLSKGGRHHPYNLQIVSSRYNTCKGPKDWYLPEDVGKSLTNYGEGTP